MRLFSAVWDQLINIHLKEEVLEEVCGIDDGEDQYGGEVDSQNGTHQSSSQHKHKFDAIIMVFRVDKIKFPAKRPHMSQIYLKSVDK